MTVRRLPSATDFLEAGGPLLRQDDGRHNLMLAICATLVDDPGHLS
jgi:hypothetical protein